MNTCATATPAERSSSRCEPHRRPRQGASFGALVWIFQEGHLDGLLGFDSVGALDLWMPVLILIFAFGLSMDYEVFLLSRIKEVHDETGDSDLAIAVLVDATIVRTLLVPATMRLLTERNGWAPAPLRRFHKRFGLHEAPSTAPHATNVDVGLMLTAEDTEPALDGEPVGAGSGTIPR